MITSRSLKCRVECVEAEASAAVDDLGVLSIPLETTPTERVAW